MAFRFNPLTSQLDIVDGSGGDVFGPASSTDNAITRYDGMTGKLIQNSLAILQDGGAIESQGFLTRRSITQLVTVLPGESWIAPELELDGGAIEIEPDGEVIIV